MRDTFTELVKWKFVSIVVETPLKECLDCIKTYRNNGGLLAETDTSNNTLILLFLCSKLFPLKNNNESELEEIMELLEVNKGIVNIKNSSGLTPMLKAAYLGSYKCITMLWRKGAKLNSRDSSGNTPLHAVLSKGTQYILGNITKVTHVTFLAHLSWKLKWAFLITCRPSSVCLSVRLSVCPSVCLSVRPSVNFSYFHLLLQNHWANFNQTWHKASLGEGDSSLFKWSAPPFSKGR